MTEPQDPGKVSKNTGLHPDDHNILGLDSPTYPVFWAAYRVCPLCSKVGAYCYRKKVVCYQCWSIQANKRGYTGSIANDTFWEMSAPDPGGAVKTPEKPKSAYRTTAFYREIFHIVLDLTVCFLLLYVVWNQTARIRSLEQQVNTLNEAMIFLLKEELEQ